MVINALTFPSCLETSWIVMCSSAAAPIAKDLVDEFGVSPTQSRLPVAMFLFGLSIGPIILTPLAEVSLSATLTYTSIVHIPLKQDFGRKKVITISLLVVCACFIRLSHSCCILSKLFAQMFFKSLAHWRKILQPSPSLGTHLSQLRNQC
jgi:MFS family permease